MEKILTFIFSIRWQDLVDIAFNSYILFRLYALFRGMDVFRVLLGIAFLWVGQRLVVSMGLVLTSWMFEGIIAVGALIVIVVFRNEIRSVFRARNIWTILWGMPQKQAKTPVEIIVESVHALAQRRIGALIVVPGKEDLEEVIQKGVIWDGKISDEMLRSIFWPNNPVHDGAAIVRGDRVLQVGAILPLSQRKDLPQSYGTRHRAASGLSEMTDALVIAVSEERGTVTLTRGTDVRSIRSDVELTLLLKEHLGIREARGRHIKRRRIELWTAAVVSLLFVSVVWFSISRGLDTLKTFEIPIEYDNRDPKMELLNTSATAARIYLRGSRALLKSIRAEQIRIKIDLNKAVSGPNTFAITREDLSIPPGVSLKEIRPMVVEVVLDEQIQKVFPVQADWVGKLAPGLIMVRAIVTPSRVTLLGPKTLLEGMSTIYTERIPLNAIQSSGKTDIDLVIPSAFKMKPGSRESVTVSYEIQKRK